MASILIALAPFAILLLEPKSTHQVFIQDEYSGSFLNAVDCSSVDWTEKEPELWDVIQMKDNFLIRNKKQKSYLSLVSNQLLLSFSVSMAKKFTSDEANKLGFRFIYCFNNDFNYMKDVYLNS